MAPAVSSLRSEGIPPPQAADSKRTAYALKAARTRHSALPRPAELLVSGCRHSPEAARAEWTVPLLGQPLAGVRGHIATAHLVLRHSTPILSARIGANWVRRRPDVNGITGSASSGAQTRDAADAAA